MNFFTATRDGAYEYATAPTGIVTVIRLEHRREGSHGRGLYLSVTQQSRRGRAKQFAFVRLVEAGNASQAFDVVREAVPSSLPEAPPPAPAVSLNNPIHALVISTIDGIQVTLHSTDARAHSRLDTWVRENWGQEFDSEPLPENRKQRIERYFGHVRSDEWLIRACAIDAV